MDHTVKLALGIIVVAAIVFKLKPRKRPGSDTSPAQPVGPSLEHGGSAPPAAAASKDAPTATPLGLQASEASPGAVVQTASDGHPRSTPAGASTGAPPMPKKVGEYDVFISHCGVDTKRNLAVWLKEELENVGVRCFFDDHNLEVGDQAAAEMLEAMDTATYGVVILSPGFFEREWCMKELQTFVRRGRIVPIFLPDFEAVEKACKAAVKGRAWTRFKEFVRTEKEFLEATNRSQNFTGMRLSAEDGWWHTCVHKARDEVLRLLEKEKGGVRISEDDLLVGQHEHLIDADTTVLYDNRAPTDPQADVPLSAQSPLQADLAIMLYYSLDNDAVAVQERVRSAVDNVLVVPSIYQIEHAIAASSVVYLHILRQVENCTIERLISAILDVSGSPPIVTISTACRQHTAELQNQGGRLIISPVPDAPVIDLVFHYASGAHVDECDQSGFLVAHGFNLLCHSNLKLTWRGKGLGARPLDVDLIHEETLEESGLRHLVEKPESVAMMLPTLEDLPSDVVYLECWLGFRPVIGRVLIRISESLLPRKGPPPINPKTWTCDVFISHTGSDKNLANTLCRDIINLGLRPFFDLESLKGTMGNDRIMDSAAGTAPVGVLLLSPSFFERDWPVRELVSIVKAQTHLPVWIGANFDELKTRLETKPSGAGAQLSGEEWADLVAALKNTTTIVEGGQFTATLIDKILFAIVMRCHGLCLKLGNQDKYNSMQLQTFRDRVLRAVDDIVDLRLRSLQSGDVKRAMRWREDLRALNNEVGGF